MIASDISGIGGIGNIGVEELSDVSDISDISHFGGVSGVRAIDVKRYIPFLWDYARLPGFQYQSALAPCQLHMFSGNGCCAPYSRLEF